MFTKHAYIAQYTDAFFCSDNVPNVCIGFSATDCVAVFSPNFIIV